MQLKHVGHAALLLALAKILPAAPPVDAPTLRLPDTVAPVSYRADLKIDPAKDTFTGSIAVKVEVKTPVTEIWLNGSKLDVRDVSLSSQGKTFPGHAVVSGEDFIGLQFASPIPAGAAEIRMSYTGTVRTGASEAHSGRRTLGTSTSLRSLSRSMRAMFFRALMSRPTRCRGSLLCTCRHRKRL